MSIWPIDDPAGAHSAHALLAAPGNDVDEAPYGYPWDESPIEQLLDGGPCPDCGSLTPALCTCRPGGKRPELDDPNLEEIGRVF